MKHGKRKFVKSLILSLALTVSFGVLANATTPIDKTHWLEDVYVRPMTSYNQFNEPYVQNLFYDKEGNMIDITKHTIYIDDNNNRYYYPYDTNKFHNH